MRKFHKVAALWLPPSFIYTHDGSHTPLLFIFSLEPNPSLQVSKLLPSLLLQSFSTTFVLSKAVDKIVVNCSSLGVHIGKFTCPSFVLAIYVFHVLARDY